MRGFVLTTLVTLLATPTPPPRTFSARMRAVTAEAVTVHLRGEPGATVTADTRPGLLVVLDAQGEAVMHVPYSGLSQHRTDVWLRARKDDRPVGSHRLALPFTAPEAALLGKPQGPAGVWALLARQDRSPYDRGRAQWSIRGTLTPLGARGVGTEDDLWIHGPPGLTVTLGRATLALGQERWGTIAFPAVTETVVRELTRGELTQRKATRAFPLTLRRGPASVRGLFEVTLDNPHDAAVAHITRWDALQREVPVFGMGGRKDTLVFVVEASGNNSRSQVRLHGAGQRVGEAGLVALSRPGKLHRAAICGPVSTQTWRVDHLVELRDASSHRLLSTATLAAPQGPCAEVWGKAYEFHPTATQAAQLASRWLQQYGK